MENKIVPTKLPSDLAKSFTPTQVALITSTIARGATMDELQLFLYTAKRTGLDPLTRQIHFVKRKSRQFDGSYKDQMTVQTGIDGYRAIAERTKNLAGIDDAVYDSEESDHPNKATVTVYRIVDGQRVGFTATARWIEYAQYIGSNDQRRLGPMWAKMPYLMLAKCAEALALRKAFPNDLSGLYTTEEMMQADNPIVSVDSVPSVPNAHQAVEASEIPVHEGHDGPLSDDPGAAPVLVCADCNADITSAEHRFSQRIFGRPLCRMHQAEEKRAKTAQA